jgi:hypothetical protein
MSDDDLPVDADEFADGDDDVARHDFEPLVAPSAAGVGCESRRSSTSPPARSWRSTGWSGPRSTCW